MEKTAEKYRAQFGAPRGAGAYITRLVYALVTVALGNSYILVKTGAAPAWAIAIIAAVFLFMCVKPYFGAKKFLKKRLRTCRSGTELIIIFLMSCIGSAVFIALTISGAMPFAPGGMTLKAASPDLITLAAAEAVVFWCGIIRIYVSSAQIGIKWRVIGIICGMIPIAHLIALGKILSTACRETDFENEKLMIDAARAGDKVCATKYPILMVHGVFFRDFRYLNYWGRIPAELEKNGARIFYGNHQSAAAVADSGREIADRIQEVLAETGAEKVNIIAHSKGGLDSRYAMSQLGAAPCVASLTTVNTPHRGCEFADYLLNLIPEKQQLVVASAYNAALKKLGDDDPDFLAAVGDLTASACAEFNKKVKDPEGVFIQSTGSCLKKPSGGRFPLDMTNRFVNLFDGENDGLVGHESFEWGSKYIYLSAPGSRGISHGDVIDLNRENIKGFDVREFYVDLVHDLKKRGF